MRWPEDREARRRLVEALLDWVVALDRAEPEPEGIDPSAGPGLPDLYSALAEVEALRREVTLQGRTFSRLADASKETSAGLAHLARGTSAEIEERLAEAQRTGRREVIECLLQTREGMARSLDVARRLEHRMGGGLLGGKTRRAAFTALVRALEMNLEASDETLRELDVRELRCAGSAFDPQTMRAVEAAGPEEGEPGTVVATRRSGWIEGDRVLRHAEVRAVPANTKPEDDER